MLELLGRKESLTHLSKRFPYSKRGGNQLQARSIMLTFKLSPGTSKRGAPAEANLIALKKILKWNLSRGQLQAETTALTKSGQVGFSCLNLSSHAILNALWEPRDLHGAGRCDIGPTGCLKQQLKDNRDTPGHNRI